MMTRRTRHRLCAAMSLLFLVGCARYGPNLLEPDLRAGGNYGLPLPVSRGAVLPTAGVADSLLAAEGEDEEFVGLLTQPTPELTEERAKRFGVRLGLVIPAAAEEGSWDSGLRAGLYYRGGRKTVYELGFDYTSAGADFEKGATISSTIYSLRYDILFGRWSDSDRKATFYLLAGGEIGQESGTWDATGDTLEARGGGIDLGLGLGSPKGSWDARVVYSVLIGTDNAAGTIMAAFGYAF